jgi:hypothetical protein
MPYPIAASASNAPTPINTNLRLPDFGAAGALVAVSPAGAGASASGDLGARATVSSGACGRGTSSGVTFCEEASVLSSSSE